MAWRDNLRRGAFRGVRFHTEERQLATGRRYHNHEYPKRDENFPEDMGRKTRAFSVDAYVIGDDYMARRDQLIAVCERAGPGALVDHWGRSQQVVCEDCEVVETSREGRFARLRLRFLHAGSQPSGIGIAAAGAQLVGAAQALSTTALVSFARDYLPGQTIAVDRLEALTPGQVTMTGARSVARTVWNVRRIVSAVK